ncbi:hypothetical protein PSH91_03920 [Pseudomonas sp. FP1154]|jgi:hypothetical protein|uniref:hypothetical protein n=1 Tax=Pseudomonas TaxID=286 RepID=UPI0012EC96FF|nr:MULTISPECIES: hypothetical protein [unclassified Pseudomonas]WLG23942.1 hypothetical protein PSH91_03920 [Pseudomonas sp. FP1154]
MTGLTSLAGTLVLEPFVAVKKMWVASSAPQLPVARDQPTRHKDIDMFFKEHLG